MFAGLGSSAEGCVMEGTSLLRGASSLGEQNILSLFPNRLADLQTEKQFVNVLAMSRHPFRRRLLRRSQRGLEQKGYRGGKLGFCVLWSAEESCLMRSLSLWLPCRTSHSRAKAEAAVTAAQKAQEEARIARITAKEFSPSFQHRENGQCVPPCRPAPRTRLWPRAALCPARPCRDPKSPKMSPEWRLGLCPQLPVLTGTLGVGNCPITPVFRGFSIRLQYSTLPPCAVLSIQGSPLFTPEHPHFLNL